MIKLGLTGTIASGKSEVANIIKKEGIAVFDSDKYAKKAYYKKNCYDEIVELLGSSIIEDNKVNYKKISKIIFNDEIKRKALNSIIHPFVKEGIKEFFLKHKYEKIVCVEVPLLFEANYEDLFDKILVITSDKDITIKRMVEKRGYSKKEAENRFNSQINPKIQLKKGDYVIYNDTTIKDLKNQVYKVLEEIRSGN